MTPGQALDVMGTVRTTNFSMSGQSPIAGYVLTASDSSGDTTWSIGGSVSGWTTSGNNVYEANGGNVGIGTIVPTGFEIEGRNVGIGTAFTTTSALTVMSGNVGIGTWVPAGALDVKTGNNILVESGNVGIGSLNPGTTLDIQGSLRVLGAGHTTSSRWQARVVTVTASATPTYNTDNGDIFEMINLNTAITSMTTNWTGNPNDGDIIEFQITDGGVAETIAWGAKFESTGVVVLPTTTVISTRLNVFLQWSSADSKWQCIGVA